MSNLIFLPQIKIIMPLMNILKQSGCEITADGEITATGRRSFNEIAALRTKIMSVAHRPLVLGGLRFVFM